MVVGPRCLAAAEAEQGGAGLDRTAIGTEGEPRLQNLTGERDVVVKEGDLATLDVLHLDHEAVNLKYRPGQYLMTHHEFQALTFGTLRP